MCREHGGQAATHVAAERYGHSPNGSMHTLQVDRQYDSRRRSVDVGGLALALGTSSLGEDGMGKGWGGWEDSESAGAPYAELLSDMYTQTQTAVSTPALTHLPVVSQDTRHRLIDALDSWHFEPHKLPEDEVLACTQIIFEVLLRVEGMRETVGVTLDQLSVFLIHLRQAYRATNTYHNFQHALDVLQATHIYLVEAGASPPVSILLDYTDSSWKPDLKKLNPMLACMRNQDLFALYIAAVGHDVGHPGFTNMFMKNAQAPLSQVYDHKSPLEHMHCAFLLPIMKRHGMAHLLDRGKAGMQFRKLLLETVLATDMGVHPQFMKNFQSLIDNPEKFDINQKRILVCQALIKCADISNPSRPHFVSQHWSAALAAEWSNQASLEKQLHLPVSVPNSDDTIAEAKVQVGFIEACCLPLLEITAKPIPEMKQFSIQCADNCALWKSRLRNDAEIQTSNYPPIPYRSVSPPQINDFYSVFPLSLPVDFILTLTAYDDTCLSTNSNGDLAGSASPLFGPTDLDVSDRGTTSLSASRSPSPFSHSASNSVSSTSSDTNQRTTLPSISTQGIRSFLPTGSILSPLESSSSASGSPRSEYAPRTPASGTSSIGVGANGSSVCGSVNGSIEPSANASIRNAYKLGSIRKKKSFHRNSWTPSPSSLSNYAAFPLPIPVPPSPTPSPLGGHTGSTRQM
ncbi:HD-domain/PDEase-like protein [Schizopora paradoxa]|uniref:Phosphodiesterase n=1 Tax=Schizopora paradoxa TaxID=27342 RepID=A0A0H2SCA2_9AGAM|nr:HD-domain/PDEase-like protein [Schizopora paradoxa]